MAALSTKPILSDTYISTRRQKPSAWVMAISIFLFGGASVHAGGVVLQKDAPVYSIIGGKGTSTQYWNKSNGGDAASVSHLTLDEGVRVPEHTHDSTEILYITGGTLEMIVDGKTTLVQAGDAVYVPAGVKPAANVVGPETFEAVQIYVGPGAEERFAVEANRIR